LNEVTGEDQANLCYCDRPEVNIIGHGNSNCAERAFNIAKQILDATGGEVDSCGVYDDGCSSFEAVCDVQAAATALSQKMKEMGLNPDIQCSIIGHPNTNFVCPSDKPLEPAVKAIICNSNFLYGVRVCAKGYSNVRENCKEVGSYCITNNTPAECLDNGVLSTQTCKDKKWATATPKTCTK